MGVAAVLSLAVYIQTLRVEAARCKGRQDVQEQIDQLTDRVVEGIEDTTDDAIRELNQTADDGCLDRTVPDSLRDKSTDH